MNPREDELAPLLVALGCAGYEVALHTEHAGFVLHYPPVIPAELAPSFLRWKPHLISLLRNGGGCTPEHWTAEAEYLFAERLGIADDLGMPTHVGSSAWLLAVGEAIGASDAGQSNLSSVADAVQSRGPRIAHGRPFVDDSKGDTPPPDRPKAATGLRESDHRCVTPTPRETSAARQSSYQQKAL